uniref:Uncharacterized protein n=1 Tax=Amphimedon queenslandica TaxID=400682 RepID=A0A1X7VCN9_AMPQE
MREKRTFISLVCETIMNSINCDGEGGWTRVGYLNMTQSGATCLNGLIQKNYTNIDHPLCVCGQLRGYQFYGTQAFKRIGGSGYNSNSLEDFTVDGVSITHGSNPRKHIWAYVGSYSEDSTDNCACPCNTGYSGGLDLNATFIGSHYYCESGLNPGQPFSAVLYATDPLWDGQQCDDQESTCCPANSKMPWFYRSLDTQTTDDIELRLCDGRKEPSDIGDSPLDIIELYIK